MSQAWSHVFLNLRHNSFQTKGRLVRMVDQNEFYPNRFFLQKFIGWYIESDKKKWRYGHLNPARNAAFYCSTALNHNTLDNMLRFMTTRADVIPQTHSNRGTTITVLSAANIKSRHFKATTGNQSESSIQSYCDTNTRAVQNYVRQASRVLQSGRKRK